MKCILNKMYLVLLGVLLVTGNGYCQILKTIYGDFEITEPVLHELLESKPVQRLKQINQYGVNYFILPLDSYTRYDHSIGVMVLLRKFGASVHEQIAGLLHDVSHTVFSHVGDHVFRQVVKEMYFEGKDAYQDVIHEQYLYECGIGSILERHAIAVPSILHKNGLFRMLERELPNLCADRIEYNLYGGVVEHYISKQEVQDILDSLVYAEHNWYFNNKESAKKIAFVSLYLTEFHFGAAWNKIVYEWAAQALRRAIETQLITIYEFHYETDDIIWSRLTKSDDDQICRLMHKIHHVQDYFQFTDGASDYDLYIVPKFRGVNPLVMTSRGLQRLTSIDEQFSKEFERVKEKMKQGFYVTFID